MKAWKVFAGISCCLILATGCSTCRNPYGDCGPVWSQGACSICNPDYRAGSVLNRQGPGVLSAEGVARTAKPSARSSAPGPRAAEPAQAAAHQSDGLESRVRVTTVAQQRRTEERAVDERQATQTLKSTSMPEASIPNNLPPGTVPAPPGTKEGDKRILSVTDRRLDELQRSTKPLTAQRQPLRTSEKPSEDLSGWHPAAPHQDSTETASQLRVIDR